MNEVTVMAKSSPDPKVDRDTMLYDGEDVLLLVQVDKKIYKWVSLTDANRWEDKTYTLDDIRNGDVPIPEGFDILPDGSEVNIMVVQFG